MRFTLTVGFVRAAVSLLLFGTAVAYAQKEQHEQEAKPERPQQEHQQQARPAQQQQQQPQRAQQERPQQARPAQQQQQPQRAQQERPQQARPAPQQQQQPQRAQQERPQQARPAPQQQQQQPQRAQQQQQQVRPPQQQAAYSAPQRTEQQARGWQQQRGWLQQGGGWQGNNSWQQDRAQTWQVEHRTWDQRGGYGGYYIPEARFSLNFGSQHWFRIRNRPIIVGGYPRFEYEGFWFMLVDPWPEAWAQDWYATDDVYVGYNNGYYLYNRRDPRDGIAISVIL